MRDQSGRLGLVRKVHKHRRRLERLGNPVRIHLQVNLVLANAVMLTDKEHIDPVQIDLGNGDYLFFVFY